VLKLLQTLVGGAESGSRRVQFAAICLTGAVLEPSLAWHFVSLGTVVVAALTATDILGKSAEGA